MNPLLAERHSVLTQPGEADSAESGTPALPGFWLRVLQNSQEFAEDIEEYDEPVLEYLENIEADDLDPEDPDKGFYVE